MEYCTEVRTNLATYVYSGRTLQTVYRAFADELVLPLSPVAFANALQKGPIEAILIGPKNNLRVVWTAELEHIEFPTDFVLMLTNVIEREVGAWEILVAYLSRVVNS